MKNTIIKFLTLFLILIHLAPIIAAQKNDTIRATQTFKKNKSISKLTLLKGIISDEKTGLPLKSEIELIDTEKQEVIEKFKSNSTTGVYLISWPFGKDYGIIVSALGYVFQFKNISLSDSTANHVIVKNISLQKIDVGTTVVLNNIFFDFDKSTIRAESNSELNRLTKFLNENPSLKIEISGHPDNKGSLSYKQKLSESRAKIVVYYLIVQGINKDRLFYEGYESDQSISLHDTEGGEQLNRRTEFKIIEK